MSNCLLDQRFAENLRYWKEYLAGAPTLLQLPTDFPRPDRQGLRRSRQDVQLSATLRDALYAVGREHGVTLSMTLVAALKVLFHRYSGQDDLTTGTLIAAPRSNEGDEPADELVNTLPLRVSLAGNPRFSALLRRVRTAFSATHAHSNVPCDGLVEALQIHATPNHHPLFQVALALDPEAAGIHGKASAARGVERVPDCEGPLCDIVVALAHSANGLTGTLTYDPDLFREATITRMIVHFENLLAAVAADPRQRIGELTFLSDAEQEQILKTWNRSQEAGASEPGTSEGPCVHHLVAARARETPGAVAVVSGQETLTYADLKVRADQLARHLRRLGAGPETVVAVYLERSVDLIVAMLGILEAGAAYLPIEPICPRDRLAFMLDDARISLVVTAENLASSLSGLSRLEPTVVCMDADWPAIARTTGDDPVVTSHGRTLAYVIYTSGSTGRPKGVQIEHAALMNLLAWHHRAFAIRPTDRATQVAALGFDAAVWEIWPYLAAGASLYLPDETTRTSPRALLEWMVEHQITVSFVPTPLAEILLREKWPSTTSLRLLLVGGDTLHRTPPPGLPFTLVNNYGPTESAVVTTWHPVAPADDDAAAAPPIGRPLDHVHVYVLDRYLNPTPLGVPGELYIGGASLARGYLARPGLTAERFIPNPFPPSWLPPGTVSRPAVGERLYRTGDLVRYSPDGNLIFLGRLDSQVKIRGFRIELGEIESVLIEHPAVSTAVVIVREEGASKYLVAYVVPEQDHVLDAEDVQRHLHARLPEYMVPYSYVFLQSLPLTTNGKVDRRMLPPPKEAATGHDVDLADGRAPVLGGAPSETDDAMLREMCDAWESVLRLRARRGHPVVASDDFLKIGGDSIQAIHLALALSSMGVEVGAGDILRHRTVQALFEHVSRGN
jgi:amino acid adenylation domain-containing protein